MSETTEQEQPMGLEMARARLDEISSQFAAEPNMKGLQPYQFKRLFREQQRMAQIVAEAEEAANPTEFASAEEAEKALRRLQQVAAEKREAGLADVDFVRAQRVAAAKMELDRLRDLGFEGVEEVEAEIEAGGDVTQQHVDLWRAQRELAEGRLGAAQKTLAKMLEDSDVSLEMRRLFDEFVALGAADEDLAADIAAALMLHFDRALKGENQ